MCFLLSALFPSKNGESGKHVMQANAVALLYAGLTCITFVNIGDSGLLVASFFCIERFFNNS